jgi:hypothetical protein
LLLGRPEAVWEENERPLTKNRQADNIGISEGTSWTGLSRRKIKNDTGVAKSRVRHLVRDVPGIDPVKLDKGIVCWNPPE